MTKTLKCCGDITTLNSRHGLGPHHHHHYHHHLHQHHHPIMIIIQSLHQICCPHHQKHDHLGREYMNALIIKSPWIITGALMASARGLGNYLSQGVSYEYLIQ